MEEEPESSSLQTLQDMASPESSPKTAYMPSRLDASSLWLFTIPSNWSLHIVIASLHYGCSLSLILHYLNALNVQYYVIFSALSFICPFFVFRFWESQLWELQRESMKLESWNFKEFRRNIEFCTWAPTKFTKSNASLHIDLTFGCIFLNFWSLHLIIVCVDWRSGKPTP
jgi:hypothetical protein